MAILVNRYSASASEIVSACLQDHHRAVVIGERTWGKGSVQNVIELEDGKSALKLTTASYQRPSGKNIHRFPDAKETDEWGVMPDEGFECRLADAEMGDLMRYRRDRDILRSRSNENLTAAAPADQKPAAEAGSGDAAPAKDPAESKDKASDPPQTKDSGPRTLRRVNASRRLPPRSRQRTTPSPPNR